MMKAVSWAVAAAVASCVGCAGVAVETQCGKTVTIVVDGQARTARTVHGSVAEVLTGLGLRLGSHDAVTPDLRTVVKDGTIIDVSFGRPVSLTLDGATGTYWTTGRSVGDIVAALGYAATPVDTSLPLDTPIPLSGLALDVETVSNAQLTADGLTRIISFAASTVGEALTNAGVKVGPDDIVTPSLDTPYTNGLAITVTHVTTQQTTKDEPIPFAQSTQESGDYDKGTSQVTTPGENGVKTQVIEQTLHDGTVVSQRVVSEQVTKEPVTEVTTVGTRVPPPPATTSSKQPSTSASGSSSGRDTSATTNTTDWGEIVYPNDTWRRLAMCESSGNPRAVNPNGHYGLFQFALATWRGVGGTGNPIDASPQEQIERAVKLQQIAGWGQWECAYIIGII